MSLRVHLEGFASHSPFSIAILLPFIFGTLAIICAMQKPGVITRIGNSPASSEFLVALDSHKCAVTKLFIISKAL